MLRENYATWHCGAFELSLARPRIMGILNVTPDSFSDGGEYLDTRSSSHSHGLDMLDAGADIIDVGGESTRPGFSAVSPEEEARRIVPVIRALVDAGACVSVDTRHPEVAKMCVRLGASIINDVTGFTDPEMVTVAAATDAGCVIMHAGEVSLGAHRQTVLLDASVQMRDTSQTTNASSDEEDAECAWKSTAQADEGAHARAESLASSAPGT